MTAYVRLIVPAKLPKQQFALWYHVVETQLPTGLIGQAHLKPGVFSKFYCKQTAKGDWSYVVPLVRNLDASEIYHLVQAWNQQYPQGDFIIDHSQSSQQTLLPPLSVEDKKIEQVLHSWGKLQHNRWMDSHIKDGWRYGVKISLKDRTHPWLQPWESLPESARQSNIQGAKDLVRLLNDFGYAMIQKPTA